MARVLSLWLLAVAMASMLGVSAGHVDHVVGGSKGWKVPKSTDFYDDWAKARNFVVGDKLVFPYALSAQNVIEVSAEDYEACTMNNVIDMHFQGPTIIELTKPGPRYFYCGVGTHCEDGQKLSFTVNEAASQ